MSKKFFTTFSKKFVTTFFGDDYKKPINIVFNLLSTVIFIPLLWFSDFTKLKIMLGLIIAAKVCELFYKAFIEWKEKNNTKVDSENNIDIDNNNEINEKYTPVIIDGKKYSKYQRWDEIGRLAEEVIYDGNEMVNSKVFNQNGGIHHERIVLQEKDFTLNEDKIFYPNGQLEKQEFFKNGLIPHGKHIFWYDDGIQNREINYLDGEKNGYERWWDKLGYLTSEIKWENGKKVTNEEESKENRYGKILDLRGKLNFDDIKKAYKEKMKQYHPDKVEMMGEELRELATKMTEEINEAYDYFKERYS